MSLVTSIKSASKWFAFQVSGSILFSVGQCILFLQTIVQFFCLELGEILKLLCVYLLFLVQSLSHVLLFVTSWTASCQACSSLSPRACANSCPLSRWCHQSISFSVIPFSFCPQSFPASGSFPMSQLFESGSQSIGASASALFLSMNIKGWFPLGLTDLILLLSKGLSSVFTLFKHWVGQKCSGFFCKMLWKNPNEFFCQTNIFSTYQEVTWSFDPKT